MDVIVTMKKTKTKNSISFTPVISNPAGTTSEFVNTSSKEYAIYTAQNRAIPSVCDGLKDGQRKALWLMRNRVDKLKTVSLAGEMISSNLFTHGDASAAETISRLAAPYLNNVPLLDGIGAFGTRVGPDSWGAPRYTYVKRSKNTEALLYPDLDIVPMKPNYDGSVMEPVNFLPLIPTVLLNGVSGIAVGWSTDILPHSLETLVAATVAAIDGKPIPQLQPCFDKYNVTVATLAPNSYEFAGRVEIESNTVVRVTELPPDLSLEKFKARLNQMEDEGSINTYVDRSTKYINIEIRFKRGSIEGWTEAQFISFLKLKNKSTQRLVTLDFNNTSIRQFASVEHLVKAFVEWRVTWYTVRYEKQIRDLTRELNFAKAVKLCVEGKLPQSLPTAVNKQTVEEKVAKLTKSITLEPEQLERIVGFPSYRWAQDSINKILAEIEVLTQQISDLEQLLANPKKIRDNYKRETLALLKLLSKPSRDTQ
jgi:DNA gyrase/topoisomerase IV subunit A